MTVPLIDEPAADDDPSVNYALIPYPPPPDVRGKLRPAGILYRSLAEAGIPEATWRPLVEATRDEFGLHGTAYGIKVADGRVSWELYYYFHHDRRPLTTARIERILDRAGFEHELPDLGDRSWYSLSFDLDLDVLTGRAPVRDLHLYATHHPAEPRCAISYHSTVSGTRMENVYWLFDPARDMAAIEQYVRSSVGFDERTALDAVLWPELLGGDHVAVAHKPLCEGIYFGGVDVDTFLWFLRRTSMPGWLVDHVAERRDGLDHLRYDVGFDYLSGPDGLELRKAGFYGVI